MKSMAIYLDSNQIAYIVAVQVSFPTNHAMPRQSPSAPRENQGGVSTKQHQYQMDHHPNLELISNNQYSPAAFRHNREQRQPPPLHPPNRQGRYDAGRSRRVQPERLF